MLFGSEYDYDLADRMTAAKVTHVPVASAAQVNTRSSVYGYDALGRLTAQDLGAVQGTWGGAAGSWGVAASGKLRSDRWWLDVLDNWSVSAAGSPLQDAGGRVSTGNLDWYGTPFVRTGAGSGADSLVSRHSTTDRSDLEQVRKSVNGSTQAEAVMLRDGLGRIECGGAIGEDCLWMGGAGLSTVPAWAGLACLGLAGLVGGAGVPVVWMP